MCFVFPFSSFKKRSYADAGFSWLFTMAFKILKVADVSFSH